MCCISTYYTGSSTHLSSQVSLEFYKSSNLCYFFLCKYPMGTCKYTNGYDRNVICCIFQDIPHLLFDFMSSVM